MPSSASAGSELGQRRRRWPSSEPALGESLASANTSGRTESYPAILNYRVCALNYAAGGWAHVHLSIIPSFNHVNQQHLVTNGGSAPEWLLVHLSWHGHGAMLAVRCPMDILSFVTNRIYKRVKCMIDGAH